MKITVSVGFITPMEILHRTMMKQYHLYVFTQDSCAPCTRLKDHVETLTEGEKAELDFVPLKTPTGARTALAEELGGGTITNSRCRTRDGPMRLLDPEDGYEFCDLTEESVERFVGANNIIEHLQATLDAYTYAHTE